MAWKPYTGYGLLGGEDFGLPLQGGRTHTFFDPDATALSKTDFSKTKIKPTCATHGTGNNKCGVYPTCVPCDDDAVVTTGDGGGCLSHQRKNPITGKCEDKVSEKCPRPGERWNGYQCVKDERVITTPVGDVNVSGTLYGMNDPRNIYDFNRDYMANYSGLVSGNNIFTTGPYGLEGPESSMSGFNQIGQPWGLDFINRIGQKRPEDWTKVDEDEYVMAMSGQEYLRYKIDPLCTRDCKETVVNLGHLTGSERIGFKKKADAGLLPGQVNPRTGTKTSSVGTSILSPAEEAVMDEASILATSGGPPSQSGRGGDDDDRVTTTQTEKIKASKVKRDKKVKSVAKSAKTTKKIASDAVSRARGDTEVAKRIAKMTKDFTAAKKKDDSVYMPTFRKSPSGKWIGGF